MRSKETRWGSAFPVAAAVITGGTFFLVTGTRGLPRFVHTSVVPWAGLVLSLLSFLVGHLSYPRIHNLKVYLSGYLIGLMGIAYFTVCAPPPGLPFLPVGHGFATAVYLLAFIDIIGVSLAPAFVKYQVTKYVTWAFTGFECILLLVIGFVPEFTSAVGALASHWWIGPLAASVVLGITIRFMAGQFYLGGILTASALIYAAGWLYTAFLDPAGGVFEPLSFALAVVFFEVGSLFHWFVRMEHRIAYDPLLHIYNRDYCARILAEQSKLSVSPPFTIAMVDIDHFKKVNDTYGHQAGDQVLYSVAQTVSRVVVPTGTLCRYGGEELAVFFPQRDAKQARKYLEEARLAVEKTKVASGKKQISVTISCGLSTRTDPSQTLASVLATADKALYRAKKGGRNQVRVSSKRSSKRTSCAK